MLASGLRARQSTWEVVAGESWVVGGGWKVSIVRLRRFDL